MFTTLPRGPPPPPPPPPPKIKKNKNKNSPHEFPNGPSTLVRASLVPLNLKLKLKLFQICSVAAVVSCGSSLSSGGQSVLV